MVELDLLEVYGVDIAAPDFVRPWVWWRDRIISLVTTESRLNAALVPLG